MVCKIYERIQLTGYCTLITASMACTILYTIAQKQGEIIIYPMNPKTRWNVTP